MKTFPVKNNRTIRVLFLKATESDHWMNRLVSRLDPPFCHVEIEFEMAGGVPQQYSCSIFEPLHEYPTSCTMASSIYQDETVFLKPRTFANPNYTILTFNVTEQQFGRMYAFCKRAAESGAAFDKTGMFLSWVPCCCLGSKKQSFFCSSYITRVLQEGNIPEVSNANPSRMRPSSLYKLLYKKPDQAFSSVPFKVKQIDKNLQQSGALQRSMKLTI